MCIASRFNPFATTSILLRPAFLLLFLIFGSPLLAQVRSLSLADAMGIAKTNSPALRQQALTSRLPTLAKDEIIASAKPRLGYKAGLSYSPSTSYFGYDPALTNEGQIGAQITLDQLLIDGGVRDIRLKANEVDLERVALERVRTEKDVELAVASTYATLYRAQLECGIDSSSLDELRGYGQYVDQLHAGIGIGTSDLLKVKIQIGQEEASLRAAEDDRAVASLSLAAAIGLAPTTSLFASSFGTTADEDSLLQLAARYSVASDSQKTIDILLERLDLRSAQTEIDLSEAERKPTLALSADAGLLNSLQNIQLPPADRQTFWGASVGLTLEGPLFDWGANALRTEEKKLQHDAIEYDLEQRERGETADRARARYTLRRAGERLQSLRATMQLAEQNYTQTLARYRASQATAFEVLDAHRQSLDMKHTRTQVLLDIAGSLATLTRLAGE